MLENKQKDYRKNIRRLNVNIELPEYADYGRNRLEATIKVKADRANKRLKALQKAGLSSLSNSYRWFERSQKDGLSYLTKTGFSKSTSGKSRNELLQELADLDFFLQANTSTPTGVRKSREKGYETFKQKFGAITKNEYNNLVASNQFKKLSIMFGSDQAVNVMMTAQKENLTTRDINDLLKIWNDNTDASTRNDELRITSALLDMNYNLNSEIDANVVGKLYEKTNIDPRDLVFYLQHMNINIKEG